MEDNNGTPFTCSTEDCNLRFPTQDHLSAHRKKHGMVLNLGTKNNMFADQTPTPTRFIRNCEEVGLFQDLQNVNPFEETFRKAVEAGKTGSAAFQAPSLSTNSVGDDTLHTPHVFPHIIGNETGSGHPEKSQITGNSPGIGEEELDISSNRRQAMKVVRQEADTSQLRSTLPISKCNISVVVDSPTNDRVQTENVISTTPGAVQVILRMLADGRLVQLAAKTVDGEKQNEQGQTSHTMLLEGVEKSGNRVIFHTSPEEKVPVNKMSLAKQKLKALLGNHSPPVIDKEKIKHKESSNSKLTKTKKDSKFESQPSSRRSSTIANVKNDDDIRRKKFLERNRAAAMRCRERRKSWVADLERRAEHMLTTNQQLQSEVASLKAEVAQLKTLLLAHKDCPVTQAMSQGNIPTHMFDMAIPVSVEPSISTSGSTSSVIYLSSPHFKKKQTSVEEITFRQNLRKKLCTVSTHKSIDPLEKDENVSKKNASLDIQSNRLPSLIKSHGENSQLIKCDEYLSSSALITNSSEPFTVQDFNTFVTQKVQHNEKPVATQVIQFNPNVLHRENNLRLPSVENDDEESILQISPPSNAYS